MTSVVGNVLYQGKKVEIVASPKQWAEFKMIGGKFAINERLIKNFELVEKAYNNYCEGELRKIIDKQIAKLRAKEIELELDYTDGVKNFKQKTKLSVDGYLKLYKLDPKIDYKIGKYEKEWGINAIDTFRKSFTLYFNLDLIKFDSGSHIEYVVAHELTHIFYRDHGKEFNETLQKLYPRKADSENFFNWRLGVLFGSKQESGAFYFFFFSALAALFLYYIYSQFGIWWQNIFGGGNVPKSKFY